VDDVTFQVGESETASIVGESGSGKTSIAKCIMGLLYPTKGSILYRGKPVHKLKGQDLLQYRREVQFIFQDPYESLNPRRDVFAAVATPLRYLRTEKEDSKTNNIVQDLLSEVGLRPEKYLHRYPHQLSGGERQRLSIARALASNPKLLVADEPVSMMDASQRFDILNVLRNLRTSRDLSLLMITHDISSVKVMGGKILVLYLGKIVESGDVESTVSNPSHPYLDLMLRSIPKLTMESFQANSVEKLESTWHEGRALEKGCTFLPRCNYSTAVCSEKFPPLVQVAPAHCVACYNPINSNGLTAKTTKSESDQQTSTRAQK
jgi:oligopeptide/dipeptide ABC transporter ATP-binding protein